jgi:hypothetical protein
MDQWIIDPINPNIVRRKLTEFHELRITFTPGQGMLLQTIDHRLGEAVYTHGEDYESLNCCMDPEEVGEKVTEGVAEQGPLIFSVVHEIPAGWWLQRGDMSWAGPFTDDQLMHAQKTLFTPEHPVRRMVRLALWDDKEDLSGNGIRDPGRMDRRR